MSKTLNETGRWLRLGCAVGSALAWFGCAARAELTAEDFAQAARRAAAAALVELQQLAPLDPKAFGFVSSNVFDKAVLKLGEPLPVRTATSSALSGWSASSTPESALGPIRQLLVPVLDGHSVKCLITLRKTGGGWKTGTLGRPNLAAALWEARQMADGKSATQPGAAEALEVPDLNMWLILYRDAHGAFLARSVFDDSNLGLSRTNRNAPPAGEVFRKMADQGKKLPVGKPR